MRRLIAAAVTLLSLLGATRAPAAEPSYGPLSPGLWPAARRAQAEKQEAAVFPTAARQVAGRREIVSATLSPIAVQVGMDVLAKGGTAADAAAAVALAQVTTDAGAVVSVAGIAHVIYFDAHSRKVYDLDAGWGTYRDERDPEAIGATDTAMTAGPVAGPEEGRKTLIPGFMAGLGALHDRFGRLPFADLVQPAIWYADNGVEVSPLLGAYFDQRKAVLGRSEAGRRFLAGASGPVPKTGERFRQPELAALLRDVAVHGPRAMYRGAWAKDFVRTVRAAGGKASLADLAAYAPTWREPVSTTFQGAQVFAPGGDNTNGCAILQTLNMLQVAGVLQRGVYWRDPRTYLDYERLLWLANASPYLPNLRAFERANGLDDSCASRASPRYAQLVAPQADALLSALGRSGDPGHHSDSVVVVDRWGNVVALVHSINAPIWGGSGLVVQGVPLADSASLYKAGMVKRPPGARIPDVMAPVIALRDGAPVLAVASIGESLLAETVRLTANLLGPEPDLTTIAAAPPLILEYGLSWTESVPRDAYPHVFLDAVRAAGAKVVELGPNETTGRRGTAPTVVIASGKLATAEAARVLVFGDAR